MDKISKSRGIALIASSQLIFMVTGYGTNLILARFFGPADYGVYGLLTSLMTALNIMQVNGVPQAVSKYSAGDSDQADSILRQGLKLQIILSAALTATLFLAAPWVAQLFHIENSWYVRAVSLIFPLYSIYSLYSGYYNGLHLFRKQAIMNVFYSVAKLVLVVLLALKFGLLGVIVGFIVAPLVSLMYGFRRPRSRMVYPMRPLVAYSVPLVTFAALSTLQLSIDLFSIKALLSDSSLAGYYTAAQNIAIIPFLTLSAIGQVLFPAISRSMAVGDRNGAADGISKSWRLLLLLLLPMAGIIIGAAPGIVGLLFGASYLPAVAPLRVLVPGYVMLTLFAMLANALNGVGMAKVTTIIAGVGLGISFIACLLFIPSRGMVGAAIATDIGAGASAVAAMVIVGRQFSTNFLPWRALRMLFGAGTAGGIVFIVHPSPFITPVIGILAMAVYGGILFLVREISIEDLRQLRLMFARRKVA